MQQRALLPPPTRRDLVAWLPDHHVGVPLLCWSSNGCPTTSHSLMILEQHEHLLAVHTLASATSTCCSHDAVLTIA